MSEKYIIYINKSNIFLNLTFVWNKNIFIGLFITKL